VSHSFFELLLSCEQRISTAHQQCANSIQQIIYIYGAMQMLLLPVAGSEEGLVSTCAFYTVKIS
jgi:hypothetical protein